MQRWKERIKQDKHIFPNGGSTWTILSSHLCIVPIVVTCNLGPMLTNSVLLLKLQCLGNTSFFHLNRSRLERKENDM